MRRLTRALALLCACLVLPPGPVAAWDASRKAAYPSPDMLAPNMDRLTIRGTGSLGDIPDMTARPDGAEVGRRLGEVARDAINVLDEKRPGESDDVAINRAITKAASRGGGQVVIPNRGTPYTLNAKIVLRSNVALVGLGRPVLNLAAGVNDTMIEGVDYLTLTGKNSGGGIAGFSIRGLILDGNRLANTAPGPDSGHCIATYGRDFTIEDTYVRRCARRGLHTEYGNTVEGISPFNGRVNSYTSSITGEEGWKNQVSDLHANNINIRTASQSGNNLYDGLFTGAPGSIRGANINVWRSDSSISHRYSLHVSGASVINGAHLETGATANLRVGGGTNNLKGVWGYNLGAGGIAGIIIAGNNNVVDAHHNGSSAAESAAAMQIGETDNPVSGNNITLKSTSALGGTVKFVASNGSNSLYVTDFLNAGPGVPDAISGTPANSDFITHIGSGTNAGTDNRFGRATAKSAIGIGNGVSASNSYAQAYGNRVRSFNTGEIVRGVGAESSQGDRQLVEYSQWAVTTNATPVQLSTVDGGQITLPASTVLSGTWTIIGARADGGTALYKATIAMTARRGTGGAATLPENVKTNVIAFSGDAGVNVALAPDGTDGKIALTVTGAAERTNPTPGGDPLPTPVEWHAVFNGSMTRW